MVPAMIISILIEIFSLFSYRFEELTVSELKHLHSCKLMDKLTCPLGGPDLGLGGEALQIYTLATVCFCGF